MIFCKIRTCSLFAKKANNNNESSILQLFYEYFSLCLFAGKKTIIRFCNIKILSLKYKVNKENVFTKRICFLKMFLQKFRHFCF